ncbi:MULTISPECIES: FAD-binding oxidoreductase [unclassified Mycolicibacterium]|uniref:NAD(P)/FAD-dependent oxidoreductase n=1 Tax=unclassified Mycolicibacterium TaxID=2636767 RepID=UPI0012DC86DE|nr:MULTISPECIES: FAD-dependent oxidoreductase [unclassified Mycolicibacterium]MUL81152.1 FAD-dependent oxidoreductase [Mycolicibacterium sp. CBMA 329]MUL86918.1 FAD-dependent oxidoreductase [Mycolicibacterium sp. CBMA 331]MUL98798.1 FAD-dependent oxidoreductase [Mycolicibacterium sp. CBMA 334]MUM25657.1 FAD-dependent oxidoreductase [Mycolicibacterium sp. CBMA 295]MUM37215.1 FAD-dependent oxidoreductase [Mycolicibacterium sp. CBMA 247]
MSPDGRTTSGLANDFVNGSVSFWYRAAGWPESRPALPGSLEADVCIVGAGLTGLWAAYYLKREQPDLRIVILEKEFAGFGASGRNGGWLSAELAGSRDAYAATHGHDGVVALMRAMRGAVDEVIDVTKSEGIDADVVKDGVLHVARNQAQMGRLRETLEYERSWGATEDDFVVLTGDESNARIRVERAMGALFTPHCARVQPAKLVVGLARVVEGMGVAIYEQTEVTDIKAGRAITVRGDVRAPVILRCLEGFTATMPGQRRAWLPMNSSMVVTEPLPDSVLQQVGWRGAELLGDFAHGYMYAQRTADNRIALGGRGIPYRYGSALDHRGATQQWTIDALGALVRDMFPAAHDVPIEHAWCGVLGVPRDWTATVDFDRASGLGTAGGYVGSGLTTTNLAGHTLADLVLQRDTALTRLPWVGRRVRKWEPEPLRWLGVQAMYALYRTADRRESTHGLNGTSGLARVANKITGR